MNKKLESAWALSVIILGGPVAMFVYLQLILIDPLFIFIGVVPLMICLVAAVLATIHLDDMRRTDI